MSATSIQQTIDSLQREIDALQRRLFIDGGRERDKSEELARAYDARNSITNAGALHAAIAEIQRLESERARIREASADTATLIERKKRDLHDKREVLPKHTTESTLQDPESMRPSFPQVVIARDGSRAILVNDIARESSGRSNFDGFHMRGFVQLQPRGAKETLDLRVSGSFRVMWDIPNQTLKWDEGFDDALPELALIATGEVLDGDSDIARGNGSGLVVPVSSDLFDIFKMTAANDDELAQYVRAKILWSWRFRAEPQKFQRWEARRLGVDVGDLDHAAFFGIGRLWDRAADGGYAARPILIEQPAPTRQMTIESDSSVEYDVALSFAGEERQYVQAVATALQQHGVRVFYDEFEDLWGKDLTKELERVYRKSSRFVVIFVSRSYVEKAWPNLERQHALGGRIERMDNSVLPARFDKIELPGLPITVSYLDIGARSPADLAGLIFRKVAG